MSDQLLEMETHLSFYLNLLSVLEIVSLFEYTLPVSNSFSGYA